MSVGAVTVKLTHDKAGVITKVVFPCGDLPPPLAACMSKIFMGRDDLFTTDGETTLGPACGAPATAK